MEITNEQLEQVYQALLQRLEHDIERIIEEKLTELLYSPILGDLWK
jgi:hypothetical protein